LDPALALRQSAAAPDLPSPVSDTDLNPTELRVAVDAQGTVQHVMLEESCQKPELDQQAILAARKLRFHPAAQLGLAWGRVTIFWHCTAPPREEVVPTPPTPPTP
jgi:TonB family protein